MSIFRRKRELTDAELNDLIGIPQPKDSYTVVKPHKSSSVRQGKHTKSK